MDNKEKYFLFLDDLRNSRVTNIFGVVSYLRKVYRELTEKEGRDILIEWMSTFFERLFKAGKYYIGDICYVVNDNNWSKILEDTNHFKNRNFEYKGKKCFVDRTAYGDGLYTDQYDKKYYVDAGIIGIMSVDVLDGNFEGDGGQIIEFDSDFFVYADKGIFHFGNIIINTATDEGF
jgi:hypothetical protein